MNILSPYDSDRAGYVGQEIRDMKSEIISMFSQEFPPGEVCVWPSDTIPDGWLECDGSAISRTTYADLYYAIGETYGQGDGASTFNIPDLRSFFVRSQDSGAGVDEYSSARTNRGDGVSGDFVGTDQLSENKEHSHRYSFPKIVYVKDIGYLAVVSGYYVHYQGGLEAQPNNISLKFIIRYEKVQDGR